MRKSQRPDARATSFVSWKRWILEVAEWTSGRFMRLFEGTQFDQPPVCQRCELLESECKCPPPEPEPTPPEKLTARISIEKRKKGKVVTVIGGLNEGHPGSHLNNLLTRLKNACGAGGTIQESKIEIQGDHLERLKKLLVDFGYKVRG